MNPTAPSYNEIINQKSYCNPEWEINLRQELKKESEKEISGELKNALKIHDEKMAFLNYLLDDYQKKHDKERKELELKYFTIISQIDLIVPPEEKDFQAKAKKKIELYQSLKGLDQDRMVINSFIEYEKRLADIENHLRKIKKI